MEPQLALPNWENTAKTKLEIEAKWNQLIYQKFYSKIKIDKKKIKNEIKLNKKFTNSYLLYEILFSASKNEEENYNYNKIIKSIEKLITKKMNRINFTINKINFFSLKFLPSFFDIYIYFFL